MRTRPSRSDGTASGIVEVLYESILYMHSKINPNLYTPIAIVIAGIIVAIAIVATSVGKSAGQQQLGAQQQEPQIAVDSAKVNTAGEPIVGDVNAPVTIAYWFDYQCPFCKQNEANNVSQIVKDYVNTGKAKIVFKDFAFLGKDSDTLGYAARAVWEVAPQKFYSWHSALFQNQGQENSGWATKDKIRSITASVLTSSETSRVMQLIDSNASKYQAAMDADKAEGAKNGVQGTPAMVIGTQMVSGAQPYAQFKAAIDAELAKK